MELVEKIKQESDSGLAYSASDIRKTVKEKLSQSGKGKVHFVLYHQFLIIPSNNMLTLSKPKIFLTFFIPLPTKPKIELLLSCHLEAQSCIL